jgi:tRNA dimethylallyltransferase
MLSYLEKIQKFIEKKSDKKKLVVIYWPTASGKTKMSIDVAKKLNSEIISTDSRQIFRESDIWTAKISEEEMDWVVHHMIDICDLDEEFSVWEYKNKSEIIIENLYSENKIPILAGW